MCSSRSTRPSKHYSTSSGCASSGHRADRDDVIGPGQVGCTVTVRRPSSVAVIGGGVLGLAVARQLLISHPGIAVTVFEKENRVAVHQSGHNSGVVHAGVYYRPGSLKATLCTRGAALLREFCQQHEISCPELGKVIVATNRVPARRARRHREPRCPERGAGHPPPHAGRAGRHRAVRGRRSRAALTAHRGRRLRRGVQRARQAGAEQRRKAATNSAVTGLAERGDRVEVRTATGALSFDQVIACAGLHSDQVARASGQRADLRVIPFRGEYYALSASARDRVRGLIYPVPDPREPFVGVHRARDRRGGVTRGRMRSSPCRSRGTGGVASTR